MEPELLELLSSTITIAPKTGHNDDGSPTYGTAVSYSARIEPVTRGRAGGEELFRTIDGDERAAKWVIYINAATIDPNGLLTLPSGYDPQTTPILSAGIFTDEIAGHHVVIKV